jgi:hypothetical protein
VGLSDGADDG